MILCALAGFAVTKFADVQAGTLVGLLAGMLIAPFIPIPKAG